MCVLLLFAAPICFSTTKCSGKSFGNSLLTFHQCCIELPGVSFVSFGRCFPCPKGTYVCTLDTSS